MLVYEIANGTMALYVATSVMPVAIRTIISVPRSSWW